MNDKALSIVVDSTSNPQALQQLIDEAYLNLGNTSLYGINDLLLTRKLDDEENPYLDILWLMIQPEYFYYTCKHILNIDILPFQLVILQELWCRKFPMLIASRGGSKSFILALYCILRAWLHQGCRIVLVGAAFRQSKILFDYMEQIWKGSPILRHMIGSDRHEGPKRDIDRCTFHIGRSEVIAIPMGTGEKIRGLRANYIICDEFSSINQEIFEVVIKGFAAVSSNPVEKVKSEARVRTLSEMGLYTQDVEDIMGVGMGNQTVIAGTAYYAFNHFYSYWKRYKAIVESRGREDKLVEIFQGAVPEQFDWTDYSVIRIPSHQLPKGFLDEIQVAQSKALSHSSLYLMEYSASFAVDSDGFFKRSLIERCVTNDLIQFPSGPAQFEASIIGNPNKKYVIGIDPASESDNFAILVIEINKDHRRIVYSWTINRQVLKDRLKGGGNAKDRTFYNYCARKIRDLMKVFPTEHIGIDAQGGGIAIIEALHDDTQLEEGELPIWAYTSTGDDDVYWWEEKNKPTDGQVGLHILHAIQFVNPKFTSDANHGLRKDFESRLLLFPRFDSASIGLAIENDKIIGREYDTLEDATIEIEELKDELATIVHTQTTTGRDKWDTPETKIAGGKKGRLRKDRYSALLIANIIARLADQQLAPKEYQYAGGYVGQKRRCDDGALYIGPQNIISKIGYSGGKGISR